MCFSKENREGKRNIVYLAVHIRISERVRHTIRQHDVLDYRNVWGFSRRYIHILQSVKIFVIKFRDGCEVILRTKTESNG